MATTIFDSTVPLYICIRFLPGWRPCLAGGVFTVRRPVLAGGLQLIAGIIELPLGLVLSFYLLGLPLLLGSILLLIGAILAFLGRRGGRKRSDGRASPASIARCSLEDLRSL